MGRPEEIPVSFFVFVGRFRAAAGSEHPQGRGMRRGLFEALLQGFDRAPELFEILQAGVQLAAGGLLVLAA